MPNTFPLENKKTIRIHTGRLGTKERWISNVENVKFEKFSLYKCDSNDDFVEATLASPEDYSKPAKIVIEQRETILSGNTSYCVVYSPREDIWKQVSNAETLDEHIKNQEKRMDDIRMSRISERLNKKEFIEFNDELKKHQEEVDIRTEQYKNSIESGDYNLPDGVKIRRK